MSVTLRAQISDVAQANIRSLAAFPIRRRRSSSHNNRSIFSASDCVSPLGTTNPLTPSSTISRHRDDVAHTSGIKGSSIHTQFLREMAETAGLLLKFSIPQRRDVQRS
jgi:hypothetical protein